MRRWLPLLLLFMVRPVWAQTNKGADQPPLVQVYGSVTDSRTGKPVYDCLVAYYTLDGKRGSINPVNSDGRYSMFIPSGRPFELRVEQENGYSDLVQPMEAIPAGTSGHRQDLQLHPKP